MKVGIVVFPGSNCDRDMQHVLSDVFGFDTKPFWHTDPLPENLDAVMLPGGFSYGDRLRSGIIAAHSPAISGVRELADSGTPVLGVCNGFQILVEAGLLPGAFLPNTSLGFMCKWVELVVESNNTPFTSNFKVGQKIHIPVANGEGRYYLDDISLESVRQEGQIVFRYADNVNGSSYCIAGISNKSGNVMGMMPHPERAAEEAINSDGHDAVSGIFESLLEYAGMKK